MPANWSSNSRAEPSRFTLTAPLFRSRGEVVCMACVMSPFMLFCAAFACGACASAAPLSVRSGTANASRQEPAPPRIQFEQLVVTPHDTHTPSELLAAAHERWGGNDARG